MLTTKGVSARSKTEPVESRTEQTTEPIESKTEQTIGTEAAVAQGNVKAGFRIGAENLRAIVTFAVFTARLAELPCKAALGIVGAADESAPAADLER